MMKMKTIAIATGLLLSGVLGTNAQDRVKSEKEVAFTAAYRERDSTQAVLLGEKFLKDYPMEKSDFKADKAVYIDYYRIYFRLITANKTEVDAKIKQYYDVLPYYAIAELAYRQVHLLHYHKLVPDASLLDRSRLMISKIKSLQGRKPIEFADKTDEEWNKAYDDLYFRNILTHISILKNTGNAKEGLGFAEQAMSRYGYGIASLNEDYVQLLNMDGLKEKAQKALEASVNANQATPLMLDLLQTHYLTNNKNVAGFDAYVESLKSAEGKAALATELAAQMIKKEIPVFKMYDADGKLVSNRDWKGKVVVLDFFSSWCAPCKAAFPGVKMAQEKFAGDKGVLFYFIDVHENGKNYKEVVNKYIKDNNFPFHILFDNEVSPGKTGEVAKLLNITAIPRKMILDKNGMVRFDADSYYGSPTKLADEIKIMVELTKKI
jgi:thiol-disulfide isomerase/thioredoxin